MKKIILMFALMVSALMSANAQIAIEDAKLVDNTSVTVNGGVSTPLAFDAVFPLNTNVGIAIGKWFTPVFGTELEGTAWLGSHSFGGTDARFDAPVHNAVRGHYLGINGLVNLTNLFLGYNGTPRSFELSAVAGSGWIHIYRKKSVGHDLSGLGLKTGLDFAFNLGKEKAHTISFRPAVLWDVNTPFGGDEYGIGYLSFDKHYAQLYLGLGYTYHFKTSNGTHHFKTYDVGAMIGEIDRLNSELAKKPTEVVREIIKTVEVQKNPQVTVNGEWIVQFAQKSSELTEEGKKVLDSIAENFVVDVVGTSSPEGDAAFNQRLSEKRAAVVADYLTKRGVKVNSWTGKGVQIGAATNRLAIVTVAQ